MSKEIYTPRNQTVICSDCSTKSRIRKDIGKYRCPNCSSLLVYVKDFNTAHYLKVEAIISEDKKLRKVNPLAKTSISSHNTKAKNDHLQSDKLLTDNSLMTLSKYLRAVLWIYFIEVSFFVIVTVLMSTTAGRGIEMVFGAVLLLGGFGIFFERASGGNLYSGASIIMCEDDYDGLISKIAEKAILASFAISPLIGVYTATEILGF